MRYLIPAQKKCKLLIIGKTPPPLGGVAIHVDRLLKSISNSRRYNFEFYDLSSVTISSLLRAIWNFNIIHVHTSSSLFRLMIVIWTRILSKKVIFTFHGNLGRYSTFINYLDRCSIFMADYPILLNSESYSRARRLNKNAQLITAFIPPGETKKLDFETTELINRRSLACSTVFCTNGCKLSFDREGKEIYQISTLVKLFNEMPKFLLIVSDPNGENQKYTKDCGIIIGNNIVFITREHDFNSILELSDCFIRYTTTDGDSLSIWEAFYHGKNVIATNVVSRPEDTILVDLNVDSLRVILDNFIVEEKKSIIQNGFDKLDIIYHKIEAELNNKYITN